MFSAEFFSIDGFRARCARTRGPDADLPRTPHQGAARASGRASAFPAREQTGCCRGVRPDHPDRRDGRRASGRDRASGIPCEGANGCCRGVPMTGRRGFRPRTGLGCTRFGDFQGLGAPGFGAPGLGAAAGFGASGLAEAEPSGFVSAAGASAGVSAFGAAGAAAWRPAWLPASTPASLRSRPPQADLDFSGAGLAVDFAAGLGVASHWASGLRASPRVLAADFFAAPPADFSPAAGAESAKVSSSFTRRTTGPLRASRKQSERIRPCPEASLGRFYWLCRALSRAHGHGALLNSSPVRVLSRSGKNFSSMKSSTHFTALSISVSTGVIVRHSQLVIHSATRSLWVRCPASGRSEAVIFVRKARAGGSGPVPWSGTSRQGVPAPGPCAVSLTRRGRRRGADRGGRRIASARSRSAFCLADRRCTSLRVHRQHSQ